MIRRLFIKGSMQVSFTAARVMPTPYATSRIWGRLLNVRKCVEAEYFKIPEDQIAFYEDLFKLPAEVKFDGLRKM